MEAGVVVGQWVSQVSRTTGTFIVTNTQNNVVIEVYDFVCMYFYIFGVVVYEYGRILMCENVRVRTWWFATTGRFNTTNTIISEAVGCENKCKCMCSVLLCLFMV